MAALSTLWWVLKTNVLARRHWYDVQNMGKISPTFFIGICDQSKFSKDSYENELVNFAENISLEWYFPMTPQPSPEPWGLLAPKFWRQDSRCAQINGFLNTPLHCDHHLWAYATFGQNFTCDVFGYIPLMYFHSCIRDTVQFVTRIHCFYTWWYNVGLRYIRF